MLVQTNPCNGRKWDTGRCGGYDLAKLNKALERAYRKEGAELVRSMVRRMPEWEYLMRDHQHAAVVRLVFDDMLVHLGVLPEVKNRLLGAMDEAMGGR